MCNTNKPDNFPKASSRYYGIRPSELCMQKVGSKKAGCCFNKQNNN